MRTFAAEQWYNYSNHHHMMSHHNFQMFLQPQVMIPQVMGIITMQFEVPVPLQILQTFQQKQTVTSDRQCNQDVRIKVKSEAKIEVDTQSKIDLNNQILLPPDIQSQESLQPQSDHTKQNKQTIQQDRDGKRGKMWSKEEKEKLQYYHKKCEGQWSDIVKHFKGRNISQCSQKFRKLSDHRRETKRWTIQEDKVLLQLIADLGKVWVTIASLLPGRNSKQVRDRYINKLDPKLINTKWNPEEDQIIYQMYLEVGPKWTIISNVLQNRSENQVKNRFYYHVQAKYIGKQHDYLKETQ